MSKEALDNSIKASVIITGPTELSVQASRARLGEQTLHPVEVLSFVSPLPGELKSAIANIKGDYVYVMRPASRFKTVYSLEKAVLEKALQEPSSRARHTPRPGFWDIVFARGELPQDAAEQLCWPDDVPPEAQTSPIDESRIRRLAGVAQTLWALDTLPLSGEFFRLVHEYSLVYRDEHSRKILCALLHAADYFDNREFLSDGDWRTIRDDLDKLHNLAWEDVRLPSVCVSASTVEEPCASPLLTYIVPVFNTGKYLSRCIESLRRQTLGEIEIVCIDDGSTDNSPAVLDAFAAKDARIRVVHKENGGVGAARNLALGMARGKYVSFVDGDDWLAREMAEVCVGEAERNALDFCAYDIGAFNFSTRQEVPIYWAIGNQLDKLPVDRVVRMEDFGHLMINASACLAVYRKSFVDSTGFKFSSLKLGEDLTFTMTLWPVARRFMLLNRVFYMYRRGQPGSAVSSLTAGIATKEADDAQISMMETLLALYRNAYSKYGAKVQGLFRGRMLADILYYAEKSIAVRAWLKEKGWQGFGFDSMDGSEFGAAGLRKRWERMGKELSRGNCATCCDDAPEKLLPFALQRMTAKIERARRSAAHDTYIVTGQLNSTSNEPIDSWTFFKWLQDNGVPSKYVLWKKHPLYSKLKAENGLKDIIALEGDGVKDFEFVEKCGDALARAKAVVQENAALNPHERTWLKRLDGCAYVFLQHGVFYTWFAPMAAKTLSFFNYVNVASEKERDFILSRTPEGTGLDKNRFIVAGLPRWDSLADLSGETPGEKVVFVMLTWRSSFGGSPEKMEASAYFNRLKSLFSAQNLQRLESLGLRFVLAPHHHLVNRIGNLDFKVPVETVGPDKVSYWIRRAKMLVTDFSSVSIDFLFQGKPTVYWMLDADDVRLDPKDADDGGKVASALKETKNIYNQVFRASEVMDKIEYYANNGFRLEPEKKAVADSCFANRSGISKHLYEAIEESVKRLGEPQK